LIELAGNLPSENEKLLARQENVLVQDDWTALFSSTSEEGKQFCVVFDIFITLTWYC